MPTPTGSPLDRPDIRARFAGHDRDIEQIKRELVNIPKPAPQVAGAGIIGISHVYGGPGAVIDFAPFYYIEPSSYTLGSYEPNVPSVPITIDNVGNPGFFTIPEGGLYSFRMVTHCNLDKAGGVPLVMQVELWRSAVFTDHDKVMPTFDGDGVGNPVGGPGQQSLWDDWTIGPQYVYPGEEFEPRLKCKLDTAPIIGPASFGLTVEVTRYAL